MYQGALKALFPFIQQVYRIRWLLTTEKWEALFVT